MQQTYARLVGSNVAELISIEPEGPRLADLYHPDLVATMVPVPSGVPVAEGWIWDGEAFAAPPAAPSAAMVPQSITRRQLLLGLAGAGMITAEEALAAATSGAVPAAIDAVFAQLPPAEALGARITWATMSVAERDHPLVDALILAGLATAEQVDALFAIAAQI